MSVPTHDLCLPSKYDSDGADDFTMVKVKEAHAKLRKKTERFWANVCINYTPHKKSSKFIQFCQSKGTDKYFFYL